MTCASRSAGLDGAELGVAGFDAAAHAAEEVELPERVEAGVIELGFARRARQRCADVRGARLGVAAARVDASARDRRRRHGAARALP